MLDLDALEQAQRRMVAAEASEDADQLRAAQQAVAELLDATSLGRLLGAAKLHCRTAWPGPMRPPFVYYGGKFDAAPLIEDALGNIVNLVIPFAGGLGDLLGRRSPAKVETVNDVDALVVNVWRAIQHDPFGVARLCDEPVHEPTLHGVHRRLVEAREGLAARLEREPTGFDPQLAAWWIWGRSAWLGGGWCEAKTLFRRRPALAGGAGSPRYGRGIHAGATAIAKNLATLVDGETTVRDEVVEYLAWLSWRLRRVRITCGDWRRILTPAVTTSHGTTGVVLDPPYDDSTGRDKRIYGIDDPALSPACRRWAIDHQHDPRLRIVLCGEDDEHAELEREHGWSVVAWRGRERLWLSPHCQPAAQLSLLSHLS